jgi:aminoglycoside phosphotransferase (APT) family kinase protein
MVLEPGQGAQMTTATIRVRQVMHHAGLPSHLVPVRVESARNEVWLVGDFVIRIAAEASTRRLVYEQEVVARLPREVRHPGVIHTGRAPFGQWCLMRRVPATPLAHQWLELNEAQRYGAVLSLARALRAIHGVDSSGLEPPFLAEGSLECSHQLPVDRLWRLVDQLRSTRAIDPGLLLAATALVDTAEAVLGPQPATLVHGDFHLENVLVADGVVQAVIDFEFARAGWPELDLEVLLRFCEEPQLHVGSAGGTISRDDFRPVVTWLRDGYPELFEHPNLVERVNLCSLSYDLRDLALSLPDRPARDLPPFHPVNRLARLLDGRGMLQLIEW